MKPFLVSLLLTALLSLSTSAQTKPPATGDWPQFMGPTRDGIYRGADFGWTAGAPKVLWKRKVGQGWAGPVVSGGKLILFHRVGAAEVVECLDAGNGKELWTAQYPTTYRDDFGFDAGPRSTPTIDAGRVYTFGAEGALNCWDLKTGKNVWSVDTKKQFNPPKGFFGTACSPLVEGNVVILIVGAPGAGIVGFDKETGNVAWKATNHEASYSSPVAIATEQGRRRVLALTRRALVALDPTDGKVFWELPFGPRDHASVTAASPVIDGDTIFLSACYGAGARTLVYQDQLPKPAPDAPEASEDVLSNHYATSVVHDHHLYGFHGRQEQGCALRCVRMDPLAARWSADDFGAGTLMVVNGKLLILTEKGELVLAEASPEKFKPLAQSQILGFDVRAYPALANGLYYARDKTQLVCVDLRK